MSERKSSFFSELKRRHVDKVALAYAVVAWLLIEARFDFFADVRRACVGNAGADRIARAWFHYCRNYLVVL